MIRLYELELEKSCPYGVNPKADLKLLLDECRKIIKDFDEELITRAFYFCVDEFAEIKRSSGDPYYTHPFKVALNLMQEMNYADNYSIVAALLHDVIEDRPSITRETIKTFFNEEIADIVEGVTKIKGEYTRKLDKAATYSKLFESLIKDVRVILIKLADRLDNLRTLHHLPERKQIVIGQETLNFYTPFAQRLGLIKIKRKLEDLSLYFADRRNYELIKSALESKQKEFIAIISNLENQIELTLAEKNVDHALALEHKHVYEIYKMIENGRSINEIDNFYSVVIKLMTNDYSECYKAYGIIANLFGPVRSFEDYFSKPKINFYRAIHSSHFGPNRKLVEVIIRTEEMDQLVEQGMIGLLSIKEANKNLNFKKSDLNEWIRWMQEVVNEGEEDAIQKIWGTIRMNLDSDYITVFTPDRSDYTLPQRSTALDLAFRISDDLAFHCISTKVNGEIKSLKYELQNNDIVEIISSPNSNPDESWKEFVVTFQAVVKLYDYFKTNSRVIGEKKFIREHKEVRFRIIGDDRPGMLNDITMAIGQINIQRINLFKTADASFEGVFTLNIIDEDMQNGLFSRLLSTKGLKAVEKIDEEDF
jgi:guanosine-3',5'-bis(diphosphate) 3'-pyrophosphohydrolase